MTEKLKFYNRYNPKPITDGTSFIGQDEVCDQQSAELCEINQLLHQYEAGEISELPVVREAQYNDILITPQSYDDAKNLIDKVTKDFYSMPVETQRAFGDINTYVNDISKIALGDQSVISKYKNLTVSPINNVNSDVNITSASGIPSSSISRSDTKIGSTDVKASNDCGFGEGEV